MHAVGPCRSRLLTAIRLLPVTMLLASALSFASAASAEGLDSDGDGLFDADEIGYYLTNPNLADTDGDGVSDGFEVTVAGTNPNLYDGFGHGSSDRETYERRVQQQGAPAGDDQAPPAELPAEGDACRIEGACGGQDGGVDPTPQHCFLEDQQDPNRGDPCGN